MLKDMESIEEQNKQAQKSTSGLKNFFKVGDVFGYFFRKNDPSKPQNYTVRTMHGINRFSMLVFVVAVIYLVLKRIL
jgi:hypothetical protein